MKKHWYTAIYVSSCLVFGIVARVVSYGLRFPWRSGGVAVAVADCGPASLKDIKSLRIH